jgi:glutamyl-tRNA synthetase
MEYYADCIRLLASRITFLRDIVHSAGYLFNQPTVPGELDEVHAVISTDLFRRLEHADFSSEELKELLSKCASDHHMPLQKLQHACRNMITGATMGASIIDTMVLLGKQECLERVRAHLPLKGKLTRDE